MCIISNNSGKKLLWIIFFIGCISSIPFIVVDFIITQGHITHQQSFCLYLTTNLNEHSTYNSIYHVLIVNGECELAFVIYLLVAAVIGRCVQGKKFNIFYLIVEVIGSCWCLFLLGWCVYGIYLNYILVRIERKYNDQFCGRISPYFSSYIGIGLLMKSIMLMLFFISPKRQAPEQKQEKNPEEQSPQILENRSLNTQIPLALKSFPFDRK